MTKTGGVSLKELEMIRERLTVGGDPEMEVWGTDDYKVWVRVKLMPGQEVKSGNGWMIERVTATTKEGTWVDMERGYSVYPDNKEKREELANKDKK